MSRPAYDKRNHRLRHVLLDVCCSFLFGRPADLANQDDGFGLWILLEQLQRIDETCADNRIAADADGRTLAETLAGQLIDRFVGQRTGTRDHAYRTFAEDNRRHDTDFRLTRLDDARAVRTDQARTFLLDEGVNLCHIADRDDLRYTDNHFDAGFGLFHDGIRGKRRRHKDDRGIGSFLLHGLTNGVEHRPVEVSLTALAGRYAAHQFRTVFDHLTGVERPFRAGKALDDQPDIIANEDAHRITICMMRLS